MIYKIFLIVMAALLFGSNCEAALEDASKINGPTYGYVGFGGGTIEIREHGSVMLGDYGAKATFCNENSKYYCVNSDFFHFAVPKDLKTDEKSWNVDGREYNVVSPLRWLMVFGNTIQVVVISCIDQARNGDSGTTFYYYSLEHGLMGFEATTETRPGNSPHPTSNSPTIYVLATKQGFGARKNSN